MAKHDSPENLSDDDLVSEVADLIEEIGAHIKVKNYANLAEEDLDEHGEQ